MLNKLKHVFKDENGAAGVEYALLVATVAVAIAATASTLSTCVSSTFSNVISNW